MALGTVTVNALNLQQGLPTAVEKYFLFIGIVNDASKQNTVLYLNTDSDLDDQLTPDSNQLKTAIKSARDNAGQNWSCAVVPVATTNTWSNAIDIAVNSQINFEAVVIVRSCQNRSDFQEMQSKANSLLTSHAMRVFILTTTLAIAGAESWSNYTTSLTSLTDNITAENVLVVAGLANAAITLGILAGRLCNSAVSIADTPMRFLTGAIQGFTLPKDTDDIYYNNAHAQALNNARYSVPQLYHGYEGVYWSDGTTLDQDTGDYAVIENLRVVNKTARRIYKKAVTLIGNRAFNASFMGMQWAKNQLASAIHDMTLSTVTNKIPFPSEIQPLKDNAIQIKWQSMNTVIIYLTIRPIECPKDITTNIMLDLSAPV